ncbi:MAG: tetraacyldisaccharide 4'-kinase [Deltaproteobacteria bacterium]|nr:tetraacyldisaccharide 4'-kinase [Deltaproteobacteria bacterium]
MRRWAQAQVRRLSWMAAAPLSVTYAGILAARAAWWERYAQTPPLPTVSVGNLTIGGNGKTPFTLFLAARLRQCGIRSGIVSRGYGGQASRSARLVSDGQQIAMTPREAGDEPVMLAKSFDGPLAVARRRIDAIELLAANGLADAVVLDDGFQHVRLRRDFNLLLINQSRGLGNGWLLPAGLLREPISAIQRADAIVLIESFGMAGSSIDSCMLDIMRGERILHARLQPSALTYSENGKWREAPLLLGRRRVVAVSGVANSAGFHAMINALGAKLLRTLDYPDHYDYNPGDWKSILAAARQAEMLITTEKDLVKLERFATAHLPLYALRLKVTMEADEERQLLTLIMERISRAVSAAEQRTAKIQGGNY